MRERVCVWEKDRQEKKKKLPQTEVRGGKVRSKKWSKGEVWLREMWRNYRDFSIICFLTE